MNKINFKNGQAPYLSDNTLNKMQDNIEEAIQEVADIVVTDTVNNTQNGLMSKEDKIKLDTLEVIQENREATITNVYSAKAVNNKIIKNIETGEEFETGRIIDGKKEYRKKNKLWYCSNEFEFTS